MSKHIMVLAPLLLIAALLAVWQLTGTGAEQSYDHYADRPYDVIHIDGQTILISRIS